MRATFVDPELEALLERDGYVVLPMLDTDEVRSLKEQFEALGSAPGDPHLACHSSFHSNSVDYKLQVNAAIRAVIDPHLERTFDRQRALPSNFIAKWPSAMSGFGLHQDLSLVDEAEHRSVEVWIALDDTDHLNGALWMVPGSHKWLPGNIRGINGFGFPFGAVTRRIIQRHARSVQVPAGTAVVFNHATLHLSLPNRSDKVRLVAITDLIPEEAAHLHFFGDGEGGIDIYEIGDEFWTDNNPFTLWKPPPSAQRVGSVPMVPVDVTDEDLDRLAEQGLVIESGESPAGAPNAAKPWCHRCGSTDISVYPPDRWIGNVTLLCEPCREIELAAAASPSHLPSPTA